MKLNCNIGDLAITVKCHCPENLGSIVRIKKSKGLITWPQEDGLMQIWEVEVTTSNGWLVYERDGMVESYKAGPAPDAYLRRLTPPTYSLHREFADAEQLQIDFHEVDANETTTQEELEDDIKL